MKYNLLLLLVLLLSCSAKTYSQVNQDSMLLKSVNSLQRTLDLTDSQTNEIIVCGRQQNNQMDSLNWNKSLSKENRTASLKKIKKQYRVQLKSILGTDQWNQYKQIQIAMMDSTRIMLKQKNIPFKELDQDN